MDNKTRDDILHIAASLLPSIYEMNAFPIQEMATQAISLARSLIGECDRQAYFPNYPSDLIGCSGGWRWVIFANEVYPDGRINAKEGYFAHLISVFGDIYRTEDGPLDLLKSMINHITTTHPEGRIDLFSPSLLYLITKVEVNPAPAADE